MRQLAFAVIGDMPSAPRTKHFVGLPSTITGGNDAGHPMPLAKVLILMQATDICGVFLYRFAADGSVAGDTWHEDIDAAKDQADYEYDGAVGTWEPLQQDITDFAAFVHSITKLDFVQSAER